MMRTDHPRPDFYRDDWSTLVGEWAFQRDVADRGKREEWYSVHPPFEDSIQVPFPWQSRLSGIEDTHYTGVAWYRRSVDIVDPRGLWLVFAAVDYACDVWVNGEHAGSHEGGFDPFSLPVEDHLRRGRNTVVVRVEDPEDISEIPHGKQGGGWYTRVSGIWQPVMLERRGRIHCSSIHVQPRTRPKGADIEVGLRAPDQESAGSVAVRAAVFDAQNQQVAEVRENVPGERVRAEVALPEGLLWSPEHPYLYRLLVCVEQHGEVIDEVTSYFGLRSFGIRDGRFYLNGEEIYIRGVLAQGYHPDGLYTYPSVQSMEYDLRQAKEAGFNLIRTHIKPEEPRIYHLADRLGLLVWSEPANFGDSGFGETAQERFRGDLESMIERDYNHPSIVIWGCFNETWGLRSEAEGAYALYRDGTRRSFVRRMYERAKALDDRRPVVDNSPCNEDHVVTDINDWHAYWKSYGQWKAHMVALAESSYDGSQWNYVPGHSQGTEPMMNSECGAISADMGERDTSVPLRYVINEIRKHSICKGYIYTQLQDIEWEKNGILRYDRSAKRFGYRLSDVNAADAVLIDAPPVLRVSAEAGVEVPVALSVYTPDLIHTDISLFWSVDGTDGLGRAVTKHGDDVLHFSPVEPGNTPFQQLTVMLPSRRFSGLLRLRALDSEGNCRAQNELAVVSGEASFANGITEADASESATRWVEIFPEQYDAAEWSGGHRAEVLAGALGRTVFSAAESGFVRYSAQLPWDVDTERIRSLEIIGELSSYSKDLKQSDENRTASNVQLYVCGVLCGDWVLEDAPVDSRGRLSYLSGFMDGAYGYLKRAVVSGSKLGRIAECIRSDGRLVVELVVPSGNPTETNGVRLFGRELGRYPLGLLVKVQRDSPV